MKKWEYAKVVYKRNHQPSELCIDNLPLAMSDIEPSKGLHVDSFLTAAGEKGWELTATLLPFPKGKELSTGSDDEDDTQTFFVQDPLDIQWLIFKRES